MIRSLPNEALTEGTITSLEDNQAVVSTHVIYVIGGGNLEFVTQFAIETESALHALSLAAPDDPDREGWFKLDSYDLPDGTDPALTEATDAAEAYRTAFDLDSEVEVSGPAEL